MYTQGKHVSTMILDFRMVESVDATAVKKLKKLLRYTDRVGLKICFTNLTEKMREMFAEEGLVSDLNARIALNICIACCIGAVPFLNPLPHFLSSSPSDAHCPLSAST